jgi:hypothetical protein
LARRDRDANKLHFYIVDTYRDAKGVLHYTVAVKSLEGAGPQTRGVALAASPAIGESGGWSTCTFPLTNTGAGAGSAKYFDSDVYRLSASTTARGWTAQLRNALATARFGETVSIPVYVARDADDATAGSVTLTATSEGDPSKTASAQCTLADGQVGGTVPATLALTLGAPASFGAFVPGRADDYTATMTANVVSTAGDAGLSVADPSAIAAGRLLNGAFSLPQPLLASASSALGTPASQAPVGGTANPTALLAWSAPVANDGVAVRFKQPIGANDALRTGSHSKTLTFTLSTTKP